MGSAQSYQLLEQFVAAKRAGGVSEDLVADLDHFVVVLDGVTDKDGSSYRGLTGGRFAAETVLACISGLPSDINARVAIDAISSALHLAIIEHVAEFPKTPPGTQMAIYSPFRSEVWRVGDIHIRVGDHHLATPAPPTDAIATAFRAALLEAHLAFGAALEDLMANDPSWEVILPLLSRQDVFANRSDQHPLSYGVVNGFPVPDRHLEIISVPMGSEVVLATDGYFSANGTLADSEKLLADVLHDDPLLIRRYQGFRPAPVGGSFDDRGWVRFLTSAR